MSTTRRVLISTAKTIEEGDDMKANIMRVANRLCEMLELCGDEDFVDKVLTNVACNECFDDDDIEAAEAEEE